MSEPILADRCGACGRASRSKSPNGWCIDANGKPRCPDCEASYRRIQGRLANLASEFGDGQAEIEFRRRSLRGSKVVDTHDCMDYAVCVQSDGALGHGWECSLCGKYLQGG